MLKGSPAALAANLTSLKLTAPAKVPFKNPSTAPAVCLPFRKQTASGLCLPKIVASAGRKLQNSSVAAEPFQKKTQRPGGIPASAGLSSADGFLPSTGNSLFKKSSAAPAANFPPKNVAPEDFPTALGMTRNVPPSPPPSAEFNYKKMTEESSAYRRQQYQLFHNAKRVARREYSSRKAADKNDPALEALEHASFACRIGASYQNEDSDGNRYVDICYAEGKLSWLGANKCGSSRFCPLCAAARAQKANDQVTQALANAVSLGYSYLFITYTIPHYESQSLAEMVEKMTEARDLYNKGGGMDRLKESVGYVGRITRYEETYGQNGWHPHIHEIVICNRFLKKNEVEKAILKLKQKWTNSCQQADLIPENRTKSFDEHGFKAEYTSVPDDICKYITKMGLAMPYSDGKKDAEFKKRVKEKS